MPLDGVLARWGAKVIGKETGTKAAATVVRDLAARDVLGKDVLKLTAPRVLDDRAVSSIDQQIAAMIDAADAKKLDLTQALLDRDAPLYADQDLYTRAHALVNGWVAGGKDQIPLRKAYTRVVVEGQAPASPLEQTLVDMLATRKDRWARYAQRQGLAMPDAFKLYRGVDGEYAVKAVLDGWMDPAAKTMEVPLYDLTSWSMQYETADKFALQTAANVIYQAEIPFSDTVADKYVDGGAFIRWCFDQDEVVVGKPRGGLHIPLQDATVEYKGKQYTYANRQALAEAWKADHP
jgi:hypothetical protein